MRVVVYDKTCVGFRGRGLSPVWFTGAQLFRALRRVDAVHGVATWDEALTWLGSQREPLDEIQYWGHGKWGCALVGDDVLDVTALHMRRAKLDGVRERMTPGGLIWFRTCETLGAKRGIDFAQRLADYFGARVAGHTYIIAFHQSGLHGVTPGHRADWSADEGLAEGTGDDPRRAKWSWPWIPRTITALTGAVPAAWITR
jgi:uncharacterized protein DUF4347